MEKRGRICCGNLAKSGQTRGDHTVNTFQISGNVMATYNLGQQDIVIRDTSTKVHDGKYHVVRFIRTGMTVFKLKSRSKNVLEKIDFST